MAPTPSNPYRSLSYLPYFLWVVVLIALNIPNHFVTHATASSSSPGNNNRRSSKPSQKYYRADADDDEGLTGRGWEYDIGSFDVYKKSRRGSPSRKNRSSKDSRNPRGGASSSKVSSRGIFDWIKQVNMPRINVRADPSTTLKLRKCFRPFRTKLTIGADFNAQLGVWQLRHSWEDNIIGGRITLANKELRLSKSWPLSVGIVDDFVARLKFLAAIDLETGKARARVGFRTERVNPIDVVQGLTLLRQVPLDGDRGHIKLEYKANFAFPEPEIEFSTDNHRSIAGFGDIEVKIEEVNIIVQG
mmetsp:Transcript_10305/g.10384  ORF Transcript_10305/g.10384 Transcript_10305/m.10384 type:complete len:302 (-) Transcript_10305:476-1381(-)|eukprot:CAMPEP_0171300546 /NCGR_PEP_ID=MMETSP0816-20121228/9364_1 /TAXON_ID=420281 /ORGANISM="Proboscia inermis, Strain CCAP1064/1" /LENGTH=301 /DNA_ID=CAMNT_0011777103 /DNA_START=30 /DNA_END=935 /DNA_ORIENTATION=+